MPQIVLTDEQANVLVQATEPVELRDQRGALLARVQPPSPEEVAEARRHTAEHRRSPAQVQALMARLAELRKKGEMDDAQLHQVLARFRAGEPI